jgi:hypothetical protein
MVVAAVGGALALAAPQLPSPLLQVDQLDIYDEPFFTKQASTWLY